MTYGQCIHDRIGIGRCRDDATHYFVRRNWRYIGDHEEARVCDRHMMGDGKDGRPDFGWVEILSRPLPDC